MLVHFLLSEEICHCTLTDPIPSESVTDERSIIRGISSMAAKPDVSTFSSLFELSLVLDVGELGEKTVFAGIKAAYKLEELIDKYVVLVNNLKPRQMKFGLSEGMILAAGPGGADIFMVGPDAGAKVGMRVK